MDEKRVKKVILMLVILCIIVFILILAIGAHKKRVESEPQEEVYDLNTIEGIVAYKKGKLIKVERSTDAAYNADIYVELGPELFDPEDDMRKQFYTNMFVRLSEVLVYQNFRVIDEQKDIVIGIQCDNVNKTITEIKVNGDKNYWGNIKSQYNLTLLGNNKVNSTINIQSDELKQLIKNEWKRAILNVEGDLNIYSNYETIPDKGIEIKTLNRKVFNIVFTSEYKENVLNGLKTTSSFEEVKKAIGEPTVGSDDSGIIGYKGNDIYVFFLNNNEISVYRIEKEYEKLDEFFGLIKNFENNGSIKEFVNSVTDIWPDWDVYNYSQTSVDLRYTLKGIKIQFGISQNNGIIYDKNYNADLREGLTIKDLQQDITKLPRYTYFEYKDNIFENEMMRFLLKTDVETDEDYEEEMVEETKQ